jgi:hypothetical protein
MIVVSVRGRSLVSAAYIDALVIICTFVDPDKLTWEVGDATAGSNVFGSGKVGAVTLMLSSSFLAFFSFFSLGLLAAFSDLKQVK